MLANTTQGKRVLGKTGQGGPQQKGARGKSFAPPREMYRFPTTKQRLDRMIDTDRFHCASEENKSPHWTGAFDINKEEERMVSEVSSCENERQRSGQRQGDQIC